MDTQRPKKRNAAILAIVMGVFSPAYADSLYTYGGPFDLPIPAQPHDTKGWMDDAIVNVTQHILIGDLDARISLTHTNVFDLKIFLQSPTGTKLCLNSYDLDEFFVGSGYIHTVFDDEADVPIEQAAPPFTGRFRPRTPGVLDIFDGRDAYGPWRLQVYDAHWWDAGNLNSFELIITTPEPATVILLVLGATLMRLYNRPGNLKNNQ